MTRADLRLIRERLMEARALLDIPDYSNVRDVIDRVTHARHLMGLQIVRLPGAEETAGGRQLVAKTQNDRPDNAVAGPVDRSLNSKE